MIPAKLPKLIGSLKMRPITKRQPPKNSNIVMTAVTWALTRMFLEFCLWLSSDSPKYSLFLWLICLSNEQCRCLVFWYAELLAIEYQFRLSCLLTCSCDRICVSKRKSQIRWVILHMLIWFGQYMQLLLQHLPQYFPHFHDQGRWDRKKLTVS